MLTQENAKYKTGKSTGMLTLYYHQQDHCSDTEEFLLTLKAIFCPTFGGAASSGIEL